MYCDCILGIFVYHKDIPVVKCWATCMGSLHRLQALKTLEQARAKKSMTPAQGHLTTLERLLKGLSEAFTGHCRPLEGFSMIS